MNTRQAHMAADIFTAAIIAAVAGAVAVTGAPIADATEPILPSFPGDETPARTELTQPASSARAPG